MAERSIGEEDVVSALSNIGAVLPKGDKREHVIGYSASGRGVHIIYEETQEAIEIVTVYWVGE